jgi:Protein of unknown function (DUF4230)
MSSTRRESSTQPLVPAQSTGTDARLAPGSGGNGGTGGSGRGGRGAGRALKIAGMAVAVVVAFAVLALALSAVQLLPRLRNPFAETTVDRSQPALLKSITALSRYEAASGSFQVIVDIAKKSSFLPSFVEGTDTLFVGSGSDIAFINFGNLKGKAIVVSKNRTGVTITLPPAQLEPAVLNVKRSYVFSQDEGLLNRVGNFFSSNPNSQHQVYVLAQQKIQAAARHSDLITEANKNTTSMLTGLMHSLGFHQVKVIFQPSS